MDKMVAEIYDKYGLPCLEDREIDPDDLDSEWLEHTNIFGEYSDAASKASYLKDSQRALVDRKKSKLDEVKADLSLKIKSDPSEYGLEKATDASVENSAKTQEEYISALDEYLSAWEKYNVLKFESDVLQGAVKTMEQRRFSLENSMRLMSLQYTEPPSEPKTDAKSRLKIKKKQRSETRGTIASAMDNNDEDSKRSRKRKRK